MQNKKKLSLLFLSLVIIAIIAIPVVSASTADIIWSPTNVDSDGNPITDTTNFSWEITFDNGTSITMSSYTQGIAIANATASNATVTMTFTPVGIIGTSSVVDLSGGANVTADVEWIQVIYNTASPIGFAYNGTTDDVATESQTLNTFTMTVTENDGADDDIAIWYGNKQQSVYQVQCQGAPLTPVSSKAELIDDSFYNDMNNKVIWIKATERSTVNTYTVKFQAPSGDDPNVVDPVTGEQNNDNLQGMTILDGETNLGFITLPNLYIILGIIALVGIGGFCFVLASGKSSKGKKRKK